MKSYIPQMKSYIPQVNAMAFPSTLELCRIRKWQLGGTAANRYVFLH